MTFSDFSRLFKLLRATFRQV